MADLYTKYIEAGRATDVHLLLHLIRADVSEAKINRLLADSGDVDWTYITSLAIRHQVISIFYFNLRKLGLRDRLPENVCANLKARYLNITGENMRFRKHLADLVDLLEKSGVPAVPFKGAVLAQCLYGDSARRQYQDMDFLVPREKVVDAWAALRENGYQLKKLSLDRSQVKAFVRHNKALEFVKPGGEGLVDLHWRLSMHTRHSFDYDFCRKRLVRLDWDGMERPCLSAEDMVVYLCVHGTSHLWEGLGAVLWLAEYVKQTPDLDWPLVMRLADELGCRRMVLLGMFLADDLFGMETPERLAGEVDRDDAVKDLAQQVYVRLFGGGQQMPHYQWRLQEVPFQLKARDSWSAKWRYLIWRMFWPTQKDWRERPLPGKMAFLFFLMRPVGLIKEWGRRFKGKKV